MFFNGTLGSHASCISDSMLCFLYNLCRCTELFNAFCHVGFLVIKWVTCTVRKVCKLRPWPNSVLKVMPSKTVYGNLRRDCSHLSWRSWTFLTGLTKIYSYCTNNCICLRLAFLPHKIQKTAKTLCFFSATGRKWARISMSTSGCQHITKIWLP